METETEPMTLKDALGSVDLYGFITIQYMMGGQFFDVFQLFDADGLARFMRVFGDDSARVWADYFEDNPENPDVKIAVDAFNMMAHILAKEFLDKVNRGEYGRQLPYSLQKQEMENLVLAAFLSTERNGLKISRIDNIVYFNPIWRHWVESFLINLNDAVQRIPAKILEVFFGKKFFKEKT